MRTNQTLKVLEQKQAYLNNILKTEGKFLAAGGMKIINKQLSDIRGDINEAKHRNYVGVTENGALVYLANSEWSSMSNDCLYIEGLGSGWDSASFFIKTGETANVTIDGGQNWTETIIFN